VDTSALVALAIQNDNENLRAFVSFLHRAPRRADGAYWERQRAAVESQGTLMD
jgi:hypothetical protein